MRLTTEIVICDHCKRRIPLPVKLIPKFANPETAKNHFAFGEVNQKQRDYCEKCIMKIINFANNGSS